MSTIAHGHHMQVEAHYVYGGAIGALAGLVMAASGMLYTLILGTGLFAVPSGIAAAFIDADLSLTAGGILLGVGIHLALSFVIGVVFAIIVQSFLKTAVADGLSLVWPGLAMGALVWALNWFVLLPATYPEFLAVMPVLPALLVHLLFGLTLALYSRVSIHE